jgi:hypothetical protein
LTDLVGFTSPSGNVGCYLDPSAARCDISERDWSPPPRPADCEYDYGQGINLAAGEAPTRWPSTASRSRVSAISCSDTQHIPASLALQLRPPKLQGQGQGITLKAGDDADFVCASVSALNS